MDEHDLVAEHGHLEELYHLQRKLERALMAIKGCCKIAQVCSRRPKAFLTTEDTQCLICTTCVARLKSEVQDLLEHVEELERLITCLRDAMCLVSQP